MALWCGMWWLVWVVVWAGWCSTVICIFWVENWVEIGERKKFIWIKKKNIKADVGVYLLK